MQPAVAEHKAPMDIIAARTDEELNRLATDWQALERASPAPSPFQSWRWVRLWRRHFGADATPLALLAREADGTPLAVLPLQRDRIMGFARLTWLSLPGAQYGGLLLRPVEERQRREVFEALWQALRREQADFIELPLLPRNDPFAAFLQAHCRQGPENAAFRIDFSAFESWRDFELSLKSSARRSRKKRLNKLQRAGDLRFQVRAAGPENAAALERAMEWKRGWLTAQGLQGALPFRPAFAALMEEGFANAEDDASQGEWLVATLSLDGKPISVDVGMALDGVYYSWFSAYDAALSEHSPGKIGLWLMMQWCMENGITVYDMLANPAPYKEDWANAHTPLEHFVAPLSMAGRAYVLWLTQGEALARELYGNLPPGLKALVRKPLLRLRGDKPN